MVLEVGATFPKCVLVTHMPPDRQQAPNPTYFCKRNVENPYRSPRGQRPARSVYGDAGTGTRKKRMPSRNRSDRGCDITSRESGQTCWRRPNTDPPCRSKNDPGRGATFLSSSCG